MAGPTIRIRGGTKLGFDDPDDVLLTTDTTLAIRVRLGYDGGRPVILGLRLDQSHEPISAATLRALPLREITSVAAALVADDVPKARKVAGRLADERTPGVPWGEDHYRAVAELYKAEVRAGESPGPAIQARWNVSRAMASRYVKTAREVYGFLPPVDPKRPGVAQAEPSKRGRKR
jgi:hypothetical protein